MASVEKQQQQSPPADDNASVHVKASLDHVERSHGLQPGTETERYQTPECKAAERRVVRKLDLTLIPMVWILYMFNYLDRNNIAQARLDNFERDVGLIGNQFNVAVSILNVGYMLAQLPSNMILTRVRPSIYLPCCVLVWSCVSAATAGVTSFSGLLAVRLVLGVVEAPFFPGAFFVLSAWYTRKELALHTAVLYSGLVLATAFSRLIAVGIFAGLSGVRGLTGCGKWLFTREEREVVLQRIALDRVSAPEAESIVRSMNIGSRTLTLVLTAPPYLFGAVVSFLVAYSGDRPNERGYHISAPMAVATVGFVISASTLNVPARYFASFLYCSGAFAANAAVYSWVANSLNQTPEKRACGTAIVNLLSQLGNIWSPYFFPSSDGPRYFIALLLMMAFSALSIVASMFMKYLLKKENKKLVEEGERTGKEIRLYTE
ncbi:major facilitator superfamily transporter [Colletotrichum musicola]|uniref:Major facilitator superfamily transporter n=1 Tax=Colletotrichum musicola TaxID=2175873 RepID=A0A8H6J5V7_9PEZI|nr:major facilitator superfamily transporter [Colletotrichum musicola]